jgi:hypothetical protein
MADVVTASGGHIYISDRAVDANTDTLAEFQAMSVWTELGLVEDMGQFGDKTSIVTFAAVGDSRIRKAKGAADAGQMQVICGHDPTDAGQLLAVTAGDPSQGAWAVKVVVNDGPLGYKDSIFYFRALVTTILDIGTVDHVVRRNVTFDLVSAIISDPASNA